MIGRLILIAFGYAAHAVCDKLLTTFNKMKEIKNDVFCL